MNQDRFNGLFTNHRREIGQQPALESLQGFTVNPLGNTITAAQAAMYQTAYQRAIEENQKVEWRFAESMN